MNRLSIDNGLGGLARLRSAVRAFDWRILITGLVLAVLCANFWLGSRYPSLQGKASADPNEALSTPLGFEQHFPEPLPDQKLQHVLWSAAEWAVTNRQGMTFGLLLAAGLLTLLPLLPRARGGRFAGSVQGMLIGTPLGVCVNCAAPIGQSMLKGGARVETALATMFTSPSFNVIVLSMLFTMFPFHFAALKVASSVAMVLLVVPILSRLAARPGWRHPPRQQQPLLGLSAFQWLQSRLDASDRALRSAQDAEPRSPLAALAWVALNYPRNLWTVVKLALPLMLLAGLIGAAMAELLPWTRIVALSQVEGWLANALVLLLVSAFGTLLPIPIAFDIVICSVLWNAGVPPYVVAALLVTLGMYSIYPWSLLGTTLSWRIAALAGAAVCALGIAAGAAAQVLDQWHEIRQARATAALLAEIPAPVPAPRFLPTGAAAAELRAGARPRAAFERIAATDGIELFGAPFDGIRAPKGATPFTRIDGPAAGFERLPLPRPYMAMEPTIMHLGALASGDINGDGWPDIAMGSYHGVFLYVNLGGRYALQRIDFPAMRDWVIGDVKLVDLDGDGAPDLFFTAWMHGSHILYNRGGEFSAAAHAELPRFKETLVAASAFADVDRDGDLDIVTGATTFAAWFFYPEVAVNHLWRNEGDGRFSPEPLAGPQGDTLSLLFTDFDDDGWPDLMVGNDFDEPDRVYMNREGRLVAVTARDSPIPFSTTTTMSLDTGDIDNDGGLDLYITQIAMGSMSGLGRRLALPHRSCDINQDVADRSRCDDMAGFQLAVVRARNVEDVDICRRELADPMQQRDCAVTAYHWNRIIVRLPVLIGDKPSVLAECAKIPADFATMRDLCAAMRESPMDENQSARNFPDELPQIAHSNILYQRGGRGLADATDRWNTNFGGWSWNGKFADFDNDGWQDLFVAQGSRLRASGAYGVFYRNEDGQRFREATADFGLKDHRPTGAYLTVDYDGDGDLDLVTYPFQLTPVVWRNDAPEAGALEIVLDDARTPGNRAAIGARMEIRAADGRMQLREIKGSGGYQSHDELRAHFGLGDWPEVTTVRVTWPDGETQELTALRLKPGRYRLRRM